VKKKIRSGGSPMTALVLAGGRGRRMKADKAGLLIGKRTLLEHVLAQIAPYFEEVLIGISPGQKLGPVSGVRTEGSLQRRSSSRASGPLIRIVEDETPGLGPLGGLLAGLKAATHQACAVIACDIPDIDIALLRTLARAAADVEIAVPVGPSGLHEPLFAVYRRSIVPEIESLLERGERSLLPLYGTCRTAVVSFGDPGRIRNLNTREDYEDYLRSGAGRMPGRTAADRRRVGKRGSGRGARGAQSPARGARP
jgi:molybdopterin-guanine dinucleotide biosynthesis protein A